MELNIRKTKKTEFFQTENLTREAFWNLHKPGCDEHLVLHTLRKGKSYIPNLDFIVQSENETVGHIISTRAKVIGESNNEYEVLCVGPLCVLPKFQKQGVGTKLLKHSIDIAKQLGYKGMILFGYPDYYHRFGFINAKEYQITTKDSQNLEPFMALELTENSLANVKGKFFEDSAFETDPSELEEFEKQFPYKEKLVTDTQF